MSTGIVGMWSPPSTFEMKEWDVLGPLGDLLLGQVQLVAPLADVGGDPVLLAQRADRGVLVAGLAVLLAAPGAALCRLGGRLSLWADVAVGILRSWERVYLYR